MKTQMLKYLGFFCIFISIVPPWIRSTAAKALTSGNVTSLNHTLYEGVTVASLSPKHVPDKTAGAGVDLLSAKMTERRKGEPMHIGSMQWWACAFVCLVLVIVSGVLSGLTTGLMSFNELQLLVLQETGDDKQKLQAASVLSIIERHHLVLVSLLLTNCAAMEALPIFLDALVPSWIAILLAVTLIFFFGEVLPQALCTGPNQLSVASAMVPMLKVLMALVFVVAWPLSKFLDWIFGTNERLFYARNHLKALIKLHQEEQSIVEQSRDRATVPSKYRHMRGIEGLGEQEVEVMHGALDMAKKNVSELMVAIDQVYMLDYRTRLTQSVMKDILNCGHSRIPIYETNKNNIKGLLLVKSLIMVDSSDEMLLCDFLNSHHRYWFSMPLFVSPDSNPYILLSEFLQARSHLAIVTEHVEAYQKNWELGGSTNDETTILGIVTLEDIIEELLQKEILDEFDNQERVWQSFYSKRNSVRLTDAREIAHHTLSLTNLKIPRSIFSKTLQSTADTPHLGPATNMLDTSTDSHKFDLTGQTLIPPEMTNALFSLPHRKTYPQITSKQIVYEELHEPLLLSTDENYIIPTANPSIMDSFSFNTFSQRKSSAGSIRRLFRRAVPSVYSSGT